MKTILAVLIVLTAISATAQIPSAPPHADDPDPDWWITDVVKGCHKDGWHSENETKDGFCREVSAMLADLYLKEHPELLEDKPKKKVTPEKKP